MTFRELSGFYKSRDNNRMEEWDRAVWMARLIMSPHTGDKTPSQEELHPFRDASEAKKEDKFESQEDINNFFKLNNTNG